MKCEECPYFSSEHREEEYVEVQIMTEPPCLMNFINTGHCNKLDITVQGGRQEICQYRKDEIDNEIEKRKADWKKLQEDENYWYYSKEGWLTEDGGYYC